MLDGTVEPGKVEEGDGGGSAVVHVGLVVVHQSIATEPVSWTTWVGALPVRAGGPAP